MGVEADGDTNRIELRLRVRVAAGRGGEILAFLHEAIPFYERPGGIGIVLQQDFADDHRFIEVVRYESENAYLLDQERVAHDREMRRYLERWRPCLRSRRRSRSTV